ncbi:MAG TPA: MFS transporter, partial [Syntrophomonadaceae bacterium]|nr:MFS transporter [Syntrophomonadaceae bacterium]
LMVIIAVYAMDAFGSSPSEAGLAASIFIIGGLIARPFTGKWIQRIGQKKLLYAGLFLSLIMSLLYFVVNNIMFLLLLRFFHGVAFGITGTVMPTIAANIIPSERLGEGLGYFMLSVTLATAVGPFIGMFLSQHGSFNMIFMTCTIAGALALISSLFLSVPKVEITKEQLEELKGFKLSNFFESTAIPISLVCMIIYVCYSSIVAFLTAYAREIHLLDAASVFFVVFAIVILFSRPFTGRLFDAKGENINMYPAFIICTIGFIILSQADHRYTILLVGALVGLGFGTIQSSSQAIAVRVTPQHRLGLANSTLYMFFDLGMGVGPYICGLFIPFIGYRGLYLGMAIVSLVAMFLYYLLHGKKAKAGEYVIMK